MTRNTTLLPELLASLGAHGLAYPDEVDRFRRGAQGHVDALVRELTSMPPSGDLLRCTSAELVERAQSKALRGALMHKELARAALDVVNELAHEAADLLAGQCEGMLEQLRPRFDAAAMGVWGAVQAGVRPGMRAADVIADDTLREHWLNLPGHVEVLESIARLRILMSTALGVPPHRGTGAAEPWAQAFTAAPRPWHVASQVPHDRWLRLSESGPVRLLPISRASEPGA